MRLLREHLPRQTLPHKLVIVPKGAEELLEHGRIKAGVPHAFDLCVQFRRRQPMSAFDLQRL